MLSNEQEGELHEMLYGLVAGENEVIEAGEG